MMKLGFWGQLYVSKLRNCFKLTKLFAKLQEYRNRITNLISRRQYNDRRKITSSLCNKLRDKMADEIDGGEDYLRFDYMKLFMGTRFAIFNYATKTVGGQIDVDYFDYKKF
jgi:hypothetical protein